MTREDRISKLKYDYDEKQKEHLSACNICASIELYTISHIDRYGFNAKADVCTNCGNTFLNPRMTRDEYTQFYINTYRPLVSAYHGRLIDAKTIQVEQKEYTRHIIEELKKFIHKKHTTLLDVGGSTGVVSLGLSKEFGFKTTLIDPAPAEIDEAKKHGITTITSFIEDWTPNETYDVIGMFQTIDHLLDISDTLKKIRAVLNKNGLFLVDIVDYRHAYLRNWSTTEGIKIDHPYYLTENTTDFLLSKVGFNILKKVISRDKLHILYICEPSTENTDLEPDKASVRKYLDEIRYVQGTSWKKN